MPKKKIIMTDDNPTNLTACKEILKDLFDVFPVLSAEKMFEVLDHVIPDMILLDVDMPVMNGYEAIKQLKSDEKYRDIPVIFLTAMDDSSSEIEGLNLGAVDYITKPFVGSVLITRIEKHLVVSEGKRELKALNRNIEQLFVKKAEATGPDLELNEEITNKLVEKTEMLTGMVHAMSGPLATVIERMQTAMKLDPTDTVGHCLSIADTEAAFLMQILNIILDSENLA